MGGNIALFVFGILVLCVCLYGMWRQQEHIDRKGRAYTTCVLICMFALANEALACHLIGRVGSTGLIFTLHTLSIIALDLMVASFAYYLHALIGEKTEFSYKYANVVSIACLVDIVVVIVMSIKGTIFVAADTLFMDGPMRHYPGKVALLCLIYLFVLVVIKRNYLGEQSLVAVAIYIALPIVANSIEAAYPGLMITLPTVSLVLLVLYVLVQNGAIEEGRIREKLLEEMSMVDTLTGVNNRRAFDMQIEKLVNDERVGVVFCDINGLKTTNDRYGHNAGDKLILRLADVLAHNFRASDIFRVGGDEFVLLVPRIGQKLFVSKMERLRDELFENDNLAAMGSAYGYGKDMLTLIRTAEKDMYTHKNADGK